MNKKIVVVRIKGGLGNQLFCYAAARRLAMFNNAELVIDDVTGFVRDLQYNRSYSLDRFHISVRKAKPSERLEPFERYRRGVLKLWSRRWPFEKRIYLEQETREFDERLLSLKVNGRLYLDGLWQSENYFSDIEEIIRNDLKIIPPTDDVNISIAEKIRACRQAVALHVRWFDAPGSDMLNNISSSYYHRAIQLMDEKLNSPHYFIFSDDINAAQEKLNIPNERVTIISHNQSDEHAYADLWLMSLCRHFITANSTFSWWAAWLGGGEHKIVITADFQHDGTVISWGFKGLIPDGWLKV